ncbi:MAG: SCO family protein [Fimbriimonadaceae bacterium]|nr:SCO family protein [Fimbriimonadaceae bacterium]QYK56412.1 MAG: SCO family protein [Fimbriimonadaceae bacterium]
MSRRALAVMALVGLAGLASPQFYGYKDPPVPGQSRVAAQSKTADVRVDQKLESFVPLDAEFRDELGMKVKLGDYFVDKPVLLLPVFYKCPGICEAELMNLVESLKGFNKDFVGKDFLVVTVGIDPSETPELASQKKDTLVALYQGNRTKREERLMTERGWHFLTGDMTQIRKVTDAIGFRFTYDASNGNITHPAALVVLTPQGKISRYFLDVQYPQRLLLNSIKDAGKGQVGTREEQPFFLSCIQVDPLTGQRSLNILNTLKTLGVVTILGMVVAMAVWNRQAKRRPEERTDS